MMMSPISQSYSYEPVLAKHVPAVQSGFPPWDASDLFSIFNSSVCPVDLNPGLEKTNSCQIQIQNQKPNPGLKDKSQNRTGLNIFLRDRDDRLKRRKKSNRESARRSRMKKQKHIEDMRSLLNQLKKENRELVNQLRYVMHNCQRVTMENDKLRMEHLILHDKLLNLRQDLVLRHIPQRSVTWSCVNSTVVTVQQDPSMMRDHVI